MKCNSHIYLYIITIFFYCNFLLSNQHFVIVVASYNNKNYCEWNLKSIYNQRYNNYEVRYVDDCSDDGTEIIVKKIISQYKQWDRTKFVRNEKRVGALKNQYDMITSCKDEDVIVIVDGDDALADLSVLNYLDSIYKDPNIWLTYGQFKEINSGNIGFCKPMPEHIVKNNDFRKWGDIPSHLRTFKAGLFKRIKKEDLMLNGQFFSMTGDMAAMIPMIEMASQGHFKFIDKILLHYNDRNPISDHIVNKDLQRSIDLYIRSLPKYKPLQKISRKILFVKKSFVVSDLLNIYFSLWTEE
ncbi:glycosyltransferase family 2 protein [Candidatus Dependentiae bacterium]|nr:glycosyltransferase family 2 protein [Candidatus Dependentiae bacterium]